jgi:hypothetical protein
MIRYTHLIKKIHKFAETLKKNRMFKYLGLVLLFILFFDKLFILLVITLITQVKKLIS